MADQNADKTILPPAYKKRMVQGVAAWLALVICVGFWVWKNADATLKDWDARIPQAETHIKPVYLTPQITDAARPVFSGSDNDAPAPGSAIPVALIMTNLGLSETATKRAIEDLPSPVALAFSPYGDMPRWIGRAAGAQHEPLILLPMEPETYPKDDPGARALLSRASMAENDHNLESVLKDGKGAWGVMNFMGSTFLSDKNDLPAVFSELRKDNLVFIENPGTKPTGAAAMAAENSLPYIDVDMKVDTSATESDIGQQLIALEKLARRQGYAVGIAEPYPVSFNVIKDWADSLGKRGFRLVPLSAVLKIKAAAQKAPDAPPTPQPPKAVNAPAK